MNDYEFKKYDFERPSTLYILEDILMNMFGESVFYGSFIKTFGLKGNERVLEFGCGSGIGSRCVAKKLSTGGFLTGVDTSGYWTRKAKKRLRKYKNVEILTGDIRELDIPDLTYDIVFVTYVIHDIEPELRQGIIDSLSRKLKYNGLFFIREPIKKSHGMPATEIQSLLSNAGLTESECKTTKSEYRGKYSKHAQ
ncbi:MAG: hypothetical protein B6D58_08465 [candidate division Zixibacteria bacterium 4484_95]|nr:MAG: hypothetical protein B6D58_08465 [candidate division Zixibacteria bacterium 4484_95]RKX20458.1 MAG: hypothetical protein DRP26_01645 [candidate division Zixibacteria bacterium]